MSDDSEVSLKDRKLAEELMRAWQACSDSSLIRSEPSFPSFNACTKVLLAELGMQWDTAHGYVFPWTNKSTGPLPMTGATVPQCSKSSLSTEHQWKVVGTLPSIPGPTIRVVSVCEACSSWTYHEMDFVGYKQESLQDRIDRESDDLEDRLDRVSDDPHDSDE